MGSFFKTKAYRIIHSGMVDEAPEGRGFCLHASDMNCMESIPEIQIGNAIIKTVIGDTDSGKQYLVAETIDEIYEYLDEGSSGGGATQVNADWTEASYSNPAYIKHKPTKLSDFTNDLGLRSKLVPDPSYTLIAGDKGYMIFFSNNNPISLTVPSGLPSDFTCGIVQFGNGIITVTGGSGVTVLNADSLTKTKAKGATVSVFHSPTANTFITVGSMQ